MATIQIGSWDEETEAPAIRAAISDLKFNPSGAITQLEKFAETGSLKSMLYLADTFMRGRGLQKDFEKARYWYSRIGERGIIFGRHMSAGMNYKLNKFDEARIEFWRCAELGFLPSMYRKGHMLSMGLGGDKDMAQAREVLQTAMVRGHFGAALYYGRLLRRGAFGIANIPRGIYLSIVWRIIFITAVVKSRGELITQWDDRYVL